MGISLSAESDKGYSPLTSPPFEKGGRKLSSGTSANIAFPFESSLAPPFLQERWKKT